MSIISFTFQHVRTIKVNISKGIVLWLNPQHHLYKNIKFIKIPAIFKYVSKNLAMSIYIKNLGYKCKLSHLIPFFILFSRSNRALFLQTSKRHNCMQWSVLCQTSCYSEKSIVEF